MRKAVTKTATRGPARTAPASPWRRGWIGPRLTGLRLDETGRRWHDDRSINPSVEIAQAQRKFIRAAVAAVLVGIGSRVRPTHCRSHRGNPDGTILVMEAGSRPAAIRGSPAGRAAVVVRMMRGIAVRHFWTPFPMRFAGVPFGRPCVTLLRRPARLRPTDTGMFCAKGGGNGRQIVKYRDFRAAPAAFGAGPPVIARYGKPAVNRCAPSSHTETTRYPKRGNLERFATAVFLPQIHTD